MSKQRRIKGEGRGAPLTVWVSDRTKSAIEAEATKKGQKRSSIVRTVLESRFGA